MDVAAGNADAAGEYAVPAGLHRTGVGAAGQQDLVLAGDAGGLRRLPQVLDHLGIALHAAVLVLDGGAFAQSHLHPLAVDLAGSIAGGGDVHRDAHVRLHVPGRRPGAPAAHLLLDGEGEIQVVFHLLVLQLLHGDEQGDAAAQVVGIGGHQSAAGCFPMLGVKDAHRADGGQLFGLLPALRADVDEQVVDVHRLPAVLIYIRRGVGPDAAPNAALQPDGGADQPCRAVSADGLKPQKALVIHKGDHQADHVHMGREQDLFARSLFAADHVAQRVGADLVHKGSCQPGQQFALGPLKTGGQGRFQQLPVQFQNIQHSLALLTGSKTRPAARRPVPRPACRTSRRGNGYDGWGWTRRWRPRPVRTSAWNRCQCRRRS